MGSCQVGLVVGVGVTVARAAAERWAARAGARVARAGGWAVPCRGSTRRTRSLVRAKVRVRVRVWVRARVECEGEGEAAGEGEGEGEGDGLGVRV